MCFLLVGTLLLGVVISRWFVAEAAPSEGVRVTANFSPDQPVAPNARLELHASRPLLESEGRLAVLVGDTDVTALCVMQESGLSYVPKTVGLPLGQTSVIVYLVSHLNEWTEIARLPLLVETPKAVKPVVNGNVNGATSATVKSAVESNSATPPTAQATPAAKKKDQASPFNFIPSVSVNVKSQSAVLFFPDSARPSRLNFTDVAVQASLQGNYQQNAVSIQNQFDLAGSSVQNEALRFGQLGNNAPQVDLSSYSMQYQLHGVKFRLGQVSFGSSRQLIDSFSSRGISLTIPITKRFDISGAIMNGTSVVGFSNFFGVNRSTHQIRSATLGVELLPKRPSGFRVEFSAIKGSLLPLNNFNERTINDAEKSRGGSIRVIASDKGQRLHFDGGFTRSSFTNPGDPLLYQGRNVIPVRPVTRNARYLDISYNLLQGYKLGENRPLNLTLSFKHERVEPLFRSIAAFAQADRLNDQVDVNGTLGEIAFTLGHSRGNDNLKGIRSILQTLSRRSVANVSGPAASLFFLNKTKASNWLPRLSYSLDYTHQLAAFVPVNGDFGSSSQIPDQVSMNQTAAAEWQLPKSIRVGYRFNHSFQDNRQVGRDRSDFLNEIHGITVGLTPMRSLDLNFDVNADRSSNFDQNTINSTLRVGTNLTWRMTGRMVWALNASTTGAGDRANLNHRRDADLDIQYSWRFLSTEKNRWKKVQGQFFIRYANRYGSSLDRQFGFNTLTKLQTFNAGLNFTFF